MRIAPIDLKPPHVRELPSDPAILVRVHRDNATHKRIIEQYRTTHALCERCLAEEGRVTPGAEVHHVRPVAQGGPTEDANLLTLCKECHRTINKVPRERQREWKVNQ
jgi:predicted restriction endonuclease